MTTWIEWIAKNLQLLLIFDFEYLLAPSAWVRDVELWDGQRIRGSGQTNAVELRSLVPSWYLDCRVAMSRWKINAGQQQLD